MGYLKSLEATFVHVLILLVSWNFTSCTAQLSTTFYDQTCPNALTTIRSTIQAAVADNRRNAALLIRLHFHDCFVQGCDASILLDGASSEKTTRANSGVGGYSIIDDAKAAVEGVCPGVVSCADILAVAARDSSVEVGGPSWPVRLGRTDSTTADPAATNTDLPLGSMNLNELIDNFDNKNLGLRDMVALSGSHTIGQARCITFRGRIYDNTSNIDPEFATARRNDCPQATGTGDGNLAPLDLVTPNAFDNNYYRNLVDRRGLLNSDQVLFNGGQADSIVQGYIDNPSTFDSDFADAMVRMGDLPPPAGVVGEIRTLCTAPNS